MNHNLTAATTRAEPYERMKQENTHYRLPAEPAGRNGSGATPLRTVDAGRSAEFAAANNNRFRRDAHAGFNPFAEAMYSGSPSAQMGGTGRGRTDGGMSAASPNIEIGGDGRSRTDSGMSAVPSHYEPDGAEQGRHRAQQHVQRGAEGGVINQGSFTFTFTSSSPTSANPALAGRKILPLKKNHAPKSKLEEEIYRLKDQLEQRTQLEAQLEANEQNEQVRGEQGGYRAQNQAQDGAQGAVNPALPHLPLIDVPILEPDRIRLEDVDAFLWNFAAFVRSPSFSYSHVN
jgi:hypothetical protein